MRRAGRARTGQALQHSFRIYIPDKHVPALRAADDEGVMRTKAAADEVFGRVLRACTHSIGGTAGPLRHGYLVAL
jgi:hypothetical protein